MSLDQNNHVPQFSTADILAKYDINSKISQFLDQVSLHNEKINIVSRETSRERLNSLAADCLVPLEFGLNFDGKAFDIGTGGGFPSIPLLLANKTLNSTMIERTGKKAKFLSRMVEEFSLQAEVQTANFVEAAVSLDSGSYDFGLMKYVKLDKKLLGTALALLKPGGIFIHYSRFEKSEISVAENISVTQHCYYLDDTEQVRTITKFFKK